jgi:hypothetical protein
MPFCDLAHAVLRSVTMPRSMHMRRNSATLGLRAMMSRSWSSMVSSS